MPASSAVSDIPVIEIHQTQLKLENLDTNKSVYPGDILFLTIFNSDDDNSDNDI